MTQTVEHYRIIQTYRATGSTPYSPALAARAPSSSTRSSSSVLRPRGLIFLMTAWGGPGAPSSAHRDNRGEGSPWATISWLVSRISGPVSHHAGALRSRLPSSGSRRNARVDRHANGCSWLAGWAPVNPSGGRPASLGRAILLHVSCSHCALTPHPCSRGPPPTVQYGLQQASRGLQASGSVVEVEVVSPLPLTSASLLDGEHMSTQYKDTNRTHTF